MASFESFEYQMCFQRIHDTIIIIITIGIFLTQKILGVVSRMKYLAFKDYLRGWNSSDYVVFKNKTWFCFFKLNFFKGTLYNTIFEKNHNHKVFL